MIFEVQSYQLILWDAVYSMGVGFVTAVIYQILSGFMARGEILVFIKDVVISCVFAVLIFSYVVSFANYKVLRWYNVAFALLGWFCFPLAFGKSFNILISNLLSRISFSTTNCIKQICVKLSVITEKKSQKNKNNTQKNQKEVLKETEVLLYN